jgi:NitT/TauT family transport system substrate-binding protein
MRRNEMHLRSWLSKRLVVFATIVLGVSAITVALTSASAAGTARTALTPVTVYFNPGSADGAGIEYCRDSGVCAKHGLDVKFKYSTQGGPQIIPAMTSGQVQFGEPGYEDTIVAASHGIPIIAIAPVSVAATSDKSDWTADLSLADGPVKTLCDLPGKKVAINSLLGLGQLFVDANYYNAHCAGDPSNTGWKKIKFVAILFPQMATALQKGQVDAIWTLEPFLSVVQSQLKTTLLAGSAYRTVPHGPITALDTSVKYLHSNPEVVRKMQLAIMESNGYLASHPQETRKLIGKYTTTPKNLIPNLILPTFVPRVPLSLVQKEADFNVKFGLIKKAPPLASYNTKVPITVSDYK